MVDIDRVISAGYGDREISAVVEVL